MSLEDLKRMQSRRPGLLSPTGANLNCDHKGYIVPMVFLPQTMEVPGAKPGDPPKMVDFFVTQMARCVRCPATFSFGMEQPKAPPAPGENPTPTPQPG